MRLRTIWFGLPGATFRERIERTKSTVAMKVAYFLPRSVLYWAAVRAACIVEPKFNPSDVTAVQMMEALRDE